MHLRRDAIGAIDSTLIAIAGTAPANTIATSTATLVAAVGLSGPGALLFGALPMFGIAMAYFYLNAWRSDAGAAYSWVGRTIDPSLGFMAGWSMLIAQVLFMVVGSLPVADATLDLVNPSLTHRVWLVAAVGLLWFLLVVAMVMLGVKTTARFQRIITIVQIGGMLFFAAGAVVKGLQHPVNHPSWSWWSPIGSDGWHSFVAGALIVMFFYWGWEVTANLSEETVDRKRTPGLSGLLGMIVILTLFLLSVFGVQMVMSQAAIADSASDLLVGMANAIVPGPWGELVAGIVVVISAVGSMQTTLVSGSRTIYSMGRDRVLAPKLGELNARFLTPWNATVTIGLVSIALFIFAATKESVNAVLNESIAAIGVLVAIFYGLSAIACATYYRAADRGDWALTLLQRVWPLLAACFVFAVAVGQVLIAGWHANVIVFGLLFAGIAPMLFYRRKYASEYYSDPLQRAAE